MGIAMGIAPPPSLMVCPPPLQLLPSPQFLFAQAQLPKYNEVECVDGWILLWK